MNEKTKIILINILQVIVALIIVGIEGHLIVAGLNESPSSVLSSIGIFGIFNVLLLFYLQSLKRHHPPHHPPHHMPPHPGDEHHFHPHDENM